MIFLSIFLQTRLEPLKFPPRVASGKRSAYRGGTMNANVNQERQIQKEIRTVLLQEWDPIGVSETPEAWDEYDSYIGGVYRLLTEGAGPRALAEHLHGIEQGPMGLGFRDVEALLPVAERLHAIGLFTRIYGAFNDRDIDAVLSALHPDVDWPNGWEGGRIHGHQAVREYWTRQWAEIDPRVDPVGFAMDESGRSIVKVHQVIKDREGNLLADVVVEHVYVVEEGSIRKMEIREAG